MEQMAENTTRTRALAKAVTNRNPIEVLKLYAVVQSVHRRMEESSWKYPHALLRNEHERIFKKVDFEKFGISFIQTADFSGVFNEVYNEIAGMSLEDFLMEVLPNFVTQPERALPLLDRIHVFEYKCLALILAKMEWEEKHFGISYEKGEHAALIRGILLENEWNDFLWAVNTYAYDYESKVMGAAHNAHKILDERSCTEEFQIELYGEVREKLVKSWTGKKREWRNRIYDISHYIRGVHGYNPKLDLFNMDGAINEASECIGKIERPTEFLKAVLVNKLNDDCKIENGLIASKFFARVFSDDSLLIINPSPDFLEHYPEKYLKSSTFIVKYKPMAWVLEQQFPSARFDSFDEFQNYGDVLDANKGEKVFTKVLYFSRQIEAKVQKRLLASVVSALKETGSFFGVMAANDSIGESDFSKAFFLKRIDLFPQKAFHSVPKKKVLVEASLTKQSDHVQLMDYEFLEIEGKKNHLMEVIPEAVLVAREQLATTPKSVYTVYRQKTGKSTESTGKQQLPTPVVFSTEISFWYKTSKGKNTAKKVEAYTCYLPTEKQKKRRLLTRGDVVKGAYASVSNLIDQEEIEKWCKFVLPYKTSIHQGVEKAFDKEEGKRLLRSGNVSLKTLWYLQLDVEKVKIKKLNDLELDPRGLYANPKTRSEAELFCSPVGDLTLHACAEEFYEAMVRFCEGKELEEVSFFWSLLDNLMKYAQKRGYVKCNPVETYAKIFREQRDTAIADVRAALVKKTFRHEEERRLLQYLLTLIPQKWENLCVLIRIFSGLEPNVISALTWEDIHKVTEGVYQFWIYQQFANGGEKPIPLEHGEDYRRIPIAPTLYKLLQERLSDIKSKTGFTQQMINTLQIVATDDQIRNITTKKVTPRNINDMSRKAIVTALDIQDYVVDLPDMSEEGGTKETNFSSYRGDIFRENIRYRMIECGFTDSEIRYILGLSQITPFGKNYVDYLNEFSQLAMYQKLCRWDIASDGLVETKFYSKKIKLPQEIILPAGYTKTSLLLEVPVNQHTGAVTAQIEAKHGVSVQAVLVSDNGDDDNEENRT